jgi:hypothetical protein
VLLLLVFIRRFGEFLFETLQGSTPGALLPIEVDNRPAQDPIKPSGRFLVPHRIGVLICGKSFNQAVLDDVFGQMMIAQAAPSKPDEHIEVLENGIFQVSHGGEVNSGNHLRKQTFAMSLRQTYAGDCRSQPRVSHLYFTHNSRRSHMSQICRSQALAKKSIQDTSAGPNPFRFITW